MTSAVQLPCVDFGLDQADQACSSMLLGGFNCAAACYAKAITMLSTAAAVGRYATIMSRGAATCSPVYRALHTYRQCNTQCYVTAA
jgi:hypothetical protein